LTIIDLKNSKPPRQAIDTPTGQTVLTMRAKIRADGEEAVRCSLGMRAGHGR
jgi:hypothetical protein